MSYIKETERRRTFAIISHPDAGKTTLTEKLLLFSGAIQIAGAVKSNKITKTATSDFLEIEKQRGISVATSVMSLEYAGFRINILDTPGHKDFAEDTYRTLTAVDSVILVIDSTKGVEEQTRKLIEVCRMRATPVFIFINKLDREGRDPFDLLEELETELHISVSPFTWPIGSGGGFMGVYNLVDKNIQLYKEGKSLRPDLIAEVTSTADPEALALIGEKRLKKLSDETDMVSDLFEPFDFDLFRNGFLAPVFFGSALNNFGVPELFDTFLRLAPSPRSTKALEREILPGEKEFTGFVFKIHANLDPNHRNRIAFIRVCSGRFERNKLYWHTRLNKKMRFAAPASFMANSRNTIDEAYPGDVIGLYDTGTLKIGDTLSEGEPLHFTGIPSFAPEIMKEVINLDAMKTKQLEKGVRQLTEEGVAQLFIQQPGNRKIIGTVGELQFDVIKYRLEHEYRAKCDFRPLPFVKAWWIASNNKNELKELLLRKESIIAYDKYGSPVLMAENDWLRRITKETYPSIEFHESSENSYSAISEESK
ncbi:MAG: peptide chain release factor 3 [Bacteroidales bacterium]